jgi:hypothetical protein
MHSPVQIILRALGTVLADGTFLVCAFLAIYFLIAKRS